jgi:hypothetical protein
MVLCALLALCLRRLQPRSTQSRRGFFMPMTCNNRRGRVLEWRGGSPHTSCA